MNATFPFPADNEIANEAGPPRRPSLDLIYRPPLPGRHRDENNDYTKQKVWLDSTGRGVDDVIRCRSGRGVILDDGRFQEPTTLLPKPQMGCISTDDYFQQYMRLINRVSYRYPNPGPPRTRIGSGGSSWRHVRQIMGYKGHHLYYIDGVVKQYDMTNFNKEVANRRRYDMTDQALPLYAINRNDITSFNKHITLEREKYTYLPTMVTTVPLRR